MDRLTARNSQKIAYLINVKPNEQEVESKYPNTLNCIMDCFERLAEYEETGLSPEEISGLIRVEKSTAFKLPTPEGYTEIYKEFCVDKFKQLGIDIKSVNGVFISKTEMVITGTPNEEDETHSCDELGCSSVSHVLYRQEI